MVRVTSRSVGIETRSRLVDCPTRSTAEPELNMAGPEPEGQSVLSVKLRSGNFNSRDVAMDT